MIRHVRKTRPVRSHFGPTSVRNFKSKILTKAKRSQRKVSRHTKKKITKNILPKSQDLGESWLRLQLKYTQRAERGCKTKKSKLLHHFFVVPRCDVACFLALYCLLWNRRVDSLNLREQQRAVGILMCCAGFVFTSLLLSSLLWVVADFEKRQIEEGAVTKSSLAGPEWPLAAPRGPKGHHTATSASASNTQRWKSRR